MALDPPPESASPMVSSSGFIRDCITFDDTVQLPAGSDPSALLTTNDHCVGRVARLQVLLQICKDLLVISTWLGGRTIRMAVPLANVVQAAGGLHFQTLDQGLQIRRSADEVCRLLNTVLRCLKHTDNMQNAAHQV